VEPLCTPQQPGHGGESGKVSRVGGQCWTPCQGSRRGCTSCWGAAKLHIVLSFLLQEPSRQASSLPHAREGRFLTPSQQESVLISALREDGEGELCLQPVSKSKCFS